MNILFVSPAYKPYVGGTERVIEQLSGEFIKSEKVNRVGLLTTFMDFNYSPPRENLSLPARDKIDGIHVYRLRFFPQRLRYFYCLPAGMISFKIRKVLEDFQPDVVHFLLNEWFVANAWIYLLSRRRCKHVMLIPFHETSKSLRFGPMRSASKYTARAMDAVHVSCEHVRQRVREVYEIANDRIEIIPLGLTTDAQKSDFPTPNNSNELTILAVGRLCSDKGQMELVEIFHQTLDKLNKRAKLVLVGGDAGDREKIEHYVQKHSLEDTVEVKGFVADKDLKQIYKKADVFALLTRIESFGLVFAEAQSYGLPCIGYRIGALESAYKRGAVLVEPYERDQVAQTIIRMVNDDEFRFMMAQEAFEYAWNTFSWEKTAEEFLKVYQRIMGGENENHLCLS